MALSGMSGIEFDDLDCELSHSTDLRHLLIAQALNGDIQSTVYMNPTKIDPWFLGKLKNIVDFKAKLCGYNTIEEIPAEVLREVKVLGLYSRFPDNTVLWWQPLPAIWRKKIFRYVHVAGLGIVPAVKRINTVASEHPS